MRVRSIVREGVGVLVSWSRGADHGGFWGLAFGGVGF